MSKSHWPEFVPVLSASDIYKGALTEPGGSLQDAECRHCLSGWLSCAFPGNNPLGNTPRIRALNVLLREARAIFPAYASAQIPSINDDPHTPPALLAKAWNRAMAKLGYRKGNPSGRIGVK